MERSRAAQVESVDVMRSRARHRLIGAAVVGAGGAVRFGYPGVSFRLAFEGRRLAMEAQASGDNSYFDVIVDGGAARKIRLRKGRHTVVLVDENIGAGHAVEIVYRSETWHGTAELISFDTDGEWRQPVPLPVRRLLVLGDSVTCGEAIDRVPGAKKEPSWWDARASYGMLLALATRAAGAAGAARNFGTAAVARLVAAAMAMMATTLKLMRCMTKPSNLYLKAAVLRSLRFNAN